MNNPDPPASEPLKYCGARDKSSPRVCDKPPHGEDELHADSTMPTGAVTRTGINQAIEQSKQRKREIEMLRGAITTPEIYVGVISEAMEKENAGLRKQVKLCKETLEKNEWDYSTGSEREFCGACRSYRDSGHHTDCWKAALLAALQPEKVGGK